MINVMFDLETLPDQKDGAKESIEISAPGQYKKPESIQKWIEENGDSARDEQWRKTALDGAYGEICVIGVSIETEGGYLSTGCFSTIDKTESEMLSEFWLWLADIVGSNQWRFVAHNAKFDIPFIWHRSVINNVKPLWFNPHGRHGQHHYCTMEAWAGFGKFIKLDELAKILGIEGKSDMDGSKVYDAWIEDPQKVIEYCADDVRILRDVYNRINFVVEK